MWKEKNCFLKIVTAVRNQSTILHWLPVSQRMLKQLQAFSVIGPSTWNGLPLTLRLLPQYNVSSFNKHVKLFIFGCSWIESTTEYVF